MNQTEAILKAYHIDAQAVVPVTDRLQHIKANGKDYALKKSKLTKEQIEDWVNIYKTAHNERLNYVLPVYLTKDEQLYVQVAEAYYYLTPWLEEGRGNFSKQDAAHFYKQIGGIHLHTKKSHAIKKDKLEKMFISYQETCRSAEKELLTLVEQCESSHFPSPLELQVLTQFKDISLAIQLSVNLTDRFITQIEPEANWGTSLIHSDLKSSHIFKNYLINWERARFGHATSDLIHFFNQETGQYGQGQVLIDSFPAYLKENPLDNHELNYLAIYLLNVNPYLRKVFDFVANEKGSLSMAAQTVELERTYRRILFGIQFHEKLASFEKKISEVED